MEMLFSSELRIKQPVTRCGFAAHIRQKVEFAITFPVLCRWAHTACNGKSKPWKCFRNKPIVNHTVWSIR